MKCTLSKLCELIGATIPPNKGHLEITGVTAVEDAGRVMLRSFQIQSIKNISPQPRPVL